MTFTASGERLWVRLHIVESYGGGISAPNREDSQNGAMFSPYSLRQ